MSRGRARTYVVFAASLLLYAAGTHDRVFSAGNDASRWATMTALVDHGTAAIDDTRFASTVDRVRIDGHLYANKPPFLSYVGAAIYWILQRLFGWSFATGAGMPSIVYWVTLLLVGVPSAACVALFDLELRRLERFPIEVTTLATAALAAGSLLASFSVTLNNHTVAAALLFASLAAAWRGWPFASGLAGGLAAAVDLLPGFGFIPVAAWLLRSEAGRRKSLRFGAGVAAGLAALIATDLAATGSILPPKLVPGAVDLSAAAGPSAAGVVLPESWSYPFEALFGPHGFFVVSPVLVFGAWGLIHALRAKGGEAPERWAVPIGLGVALQIVFHVLFAGSFGGWSFGFRYLIPVIAPLLFFAPLVLSGIRRTLFALVLLVSVLFAELGAFHPWPPAYEQESNRDPIASLVTNPIGGNFAGWLEAHWPDSLPARAAGARFISRDPAARRSYFRYFFGSKGDLERMRRYEP